MKRFIPVGAPSLVGNEKKYVMDCLDTAWISSAGKYVEKFEESFSEFCGVKKAIACSNGTVALHLALLALGVGAGDEVIVPTLTYVATANAVTYCTAQPVFVDSEPETWNMDPALIEEKITPHTKGIIVVHLYGHPVDMDPILKIAREYGLFVLEDAAEAHGAQYKGRPAGALADIATFSFYGNKIITTGEGGMVVTDDEELARKVRVYKGQGVDPERSYWFPVIGYNYRMTNIQAAIGLAQLERADWHIDCRRKIASWYNGCLKNVPRLILPAEKEWAKNVYWMYSIVLGDDIAIHRDELMTALRDHGIETRPFFYPMHSLPPYKKLSPNSSFPVADRLGARGINLPTWAGIKKEEVDYVSAALTECIENNK